MTIVGDAQSAVWRQMKVTKKTKTRRYKRGDKAIMGYTMVNVINAETDEGNVRVEYYNSRDGETVRQWVDRQALELL